MLVRKFVVIAIVVLCGARTASTADAPTRAPETVLVALEKAAIELAKKNRPFEIEELLDVLVRLGRPTAPVAALRTATDKILAKSGPRAAAVPDVAVSLKKSAQELRPWLDAVPAADRANVAEAILVLDSEVAPAHEALGRVQTEGRFGPAEMPKILKRRAQITDFVRQARVLPIPIVLGESDLPIFESVFKKKGAVARAGDASIHSDYFAPARLERMLREVLRATALCCALRTGTVAVPKFVAKFAFAPIGSRPKLELAAREAFEHQGLDQEEFERTKSTGTFIDRRGWTVTQHQIEAQAEASCFFQLFFSYEKAAETVRGQCCLDAGQLEWVCRLYLGTRLPGIAYDETTERVIEETTSRGKERAIERKRMRVLGEAGLAGTHRWMRWLAEHGEDPPWKSTMMTGNQLGKIRGEALLKATIVAEYLQETGEFDPLWQATAPYELRHAAATAIPGIISKALGQELAAFEARWRAWLIPQKAGLAQRLAASPTPTLDAGLRSVLTRLDALRREAMPRAKNDPLFELGNDPELSAGCRAHAHYLGKHPGQTAKWPDAHEEYPDQEGFSPEGSLGGLNSVIAPGTKDPADAVTAWMGTFYHRLPLLDPGLVQIGWGFESGVAVLDVGSMVTPAPPTRVMWPPAGAKNVPLAFVPELPNPVPGENQSEFGYPITLQVFGEDTAIDLRLTLSGEGGAAETACHFSSPEHPTNPDLAPRGVWCLIPKAPLRPTTRYRVTASDAKSGAATTWVFTTR